jgi:hypothetical protein
LIDGLSTTSPQALKQMADLSILLSATNRQNVSCHSASESQIPAGISHGVLSWKKNRAQNTLF